MTDPSAPLAATLRVTDGPDAGKRFELRGDGVIGRDDAAEIVLTDTSGEVSRRHARIRLRGDTAVVEDLDSTNGTFLNDERVRGPRPLRAGDRIRIGATTLEFSPASELQTTRARDVPPDVARAPASTAPAGDGVLRIVAGPGAGATAELVGASATIGREPECDLQVLDSEVSRRHAKIIVRDGAATIADLRSSNGTYVNGERILGQHPLADGDRIQIGEATIELTSRLLPGTAVRVRPAQVSAVRDVVAQSSKLLTAESGSRKWWTLAVVLITTFMLLLDVTIVAVALPTISEDLHSSFSSLQWIVDGYTITLAVALLTAGSLADIFGRKRLLTIGLFIFTIASVICAQSTSTTMLDFARGLQGVGGAIMFATGLALIVQEFPAGERGIAFGTQGAVSGLSVAVGPIVGGLLVQSVGWQAIFYINVPVGIVTFIVLQRKLINLPGPPAAIDWGGLVTFSLAMFLAIFATIRGNADGWTSVEILGCFATSIVLFAAFVAIELRSRHAMFDIALFRNPTFVGASVSAFAVSFSVLALIFFLTTWLQSVLGYSPVQTGLRMLVFTGATMLSAPLAGRITETVSPQITLPLSLALSAAGILSMTVVDAGSEWTAVIPGLILGGLGVGLIAPTLDFASVEVVPPWRSGMASGINSTFREAGSAVGIAVLGSVLAHQVSVNVHGALAGAAAGVPESAVAGAISSGTVPRLLAGSPASARPGLLDIAQSSYTAGLRHIFVVAFALALISAITALALVRKRHLHPAADQLAPEEP